MDIYFDDICFIRQCNALKKHNEIHPVGAFFHADIIYGNANPHDEADHHKKRKQTPLLHVKHLFHPDISLF